MNVETKDKFERLASKFESETRNLSSPPQIMKHPAYQEIIDMGEEVVPLIIDRLKKRPWYWFNALKKLTGVTNDPFPPYAQGNLQIMADAWAAWAVGKGITYPNIEERNA